MKVQLIIEIELEDELYNNFAEEEKLWLENEILVGDGSLILHSNEIGDTLGIVKSVKNIKYLK